MAQESRPAQERAKQLRRDQTPIEALLWRRLRSGQLHGFKFRRQHPIGPFIPDFCCEEARLIIEVDGDSHVEQQVYDEARSAYLAGRGYLVMRIANRDIVNNMDGMLEAIIAKCVKRRA